MLAFSPTPDRLPASAFSLTACGVSSPGRLSQAVAWWWGFDHIVAGPPSVTVDSGGLLIFLVVFREHMSRRVLQWSVEDWYTLKNTHWNSMLFDTMSQLNKLFVYLFSSAFETSFVLMAMGHDTLALWHSLPQQWQKSHKMITHTHSSNAALAKDKWI